MNRLKRINSGNGHWYKLDGEYAPGVTTILGDGIPKPQLVNWAANTAARYVADHRDWLVQADTPEEIYEVVRGAHNRDRDQAANKGTIVHDYGEQLVSGDVTLQPEHAYLLPYVEAYARFLDSVDIEPVATETPMANTTLRYAGTGDLFGRCPAIVERLNRIDTLGVELDPQSLGYIDLKTNRSGVFFEAGLQCIGYGRCDLWQPNGEDEEMPLVEWSVIVHVHPDGCTVRPVDLHSERHWSMFRAARLIAEARRKKNGWADLVLLPELSLMPEQDLTFKAAS